MLQVIAGEYAHRKLVQPPSSMTRPVAQRVRGAIFNSLGDEVLGAKVADIFAGSGALGIEALSRGAASVDFVEKHSRAAKIIEENTDSLGIAEGVQIFTRTAEQFFRHIDSKYDIILMDPPYADFTQGLVQQAVGLLQYGGTLVVSTSSKSIVDPPDGAAVVRQKIYGDSMITVITKR